MDYRVYFLEYERQKNKLSFELQSIFFTFWITEYIFQYKRQNINYRLIMTDGIFFYLILNAKTYVTFWITEYMFFAKHTKKSRCLVFTIMKYILSSIIQKSKASFELQSIKPSILMRIITLLLNYRVYYFCISFSW